MRNIPPREMCVEGGILRVRAYAGKHCVGTDYVEHFIEHRVDDWVKCNTGEGLYHCKYVANLSCGCWEHAEQLGNQTTCQHGSRIPAAMRIAINEPH